MKIGSIIGFLGVGVMSAWLSHWVWPSEERMVRSVVTDTVFVPYYIHDSIQGKLNYVRIKDPVKIDSLWEEAKQYAYNEISRLFPEDTVQYITIPYAPDFIGIPPLRTPNTSDFIGINSLRTPNTSDFIGINSLRTDNVERRTSHVALSYYRFQSAMDTTYRDSLMQLKIKFNSPIPLHPSSYFSYDIKYNYMSIRSVEMVNNSTFLDRFRLSVNAGMGYGIINRSFDIYIGLGGSFNL